MSKSEKKLAECITLAKGKPPAQIPFYGEGAEPYLSPEYLRGNAFAELAKPAVNAVRVEDDDTILLWDGSNAGEFLKGRRGLLASTMSRISHGDEFNREYFYYALKRWESFLKGQTSGSGIPHVDKEILGNLEILCLKLEDQTRIATILSTLDRAIEQTAAIIAKQQRIKTGLMQDLLTKGIDEHGVIRSEATHEFKDSPLGRIPVEWEVASLGDIISKHGGKLQTGPFGSQLHAYEYVAEGVPVVMPQDIITSGISTDEIARIPEGKAKQLLRHNMLPGDLIFARRGDLSRCAWITEREEGWVCGTGCLLLRPPMKVLSSRWMAEIYRFHKTQVQVDIQAVGSTMPNLNTGILAGLIICLPKFEEQVRVEKYLCAIEGDQLKIHALHRKLMSQKTGLMHDLLTGTVQVNDKIKQLTAN